MVEVEYAGFKYDITEDGDGGFTVTPLPGQHRAVNKDKHRRAALEEYRDGLRRKQRKKDD